jgi:hypothetical protein
MTSGATIESEFPLMLSIFHSAAPEQSVFSHSRPTGLGAVAHRGSARNRANTGDAEWAMFGTMRERGEDGAGPTTT